MRVFIPGVDGYLGWSLAQHLAARGHEVAGSDCFYRRRWVEEEMGSWSAIPIASMQERRDAFKERYGAELRFWEGDLTNYELVAEMLEDFRPEAVVHLGECPSAPYSMVDAKHAIFVQVNNIVTTFNLLFAMRDLCPDAHLVKLGTMGEYGTPNLDIPEGFFEVDFRGRKDHLLFPRDAGSWYHWSKVHGSNNVMFACKLWGLRATDIMQGVVFGTRIDEMGAVPGSPSDQRLTTRLDFDGCFGTAINRFCCEAVIDHPITPFGKGSQRRGFLPLRDSMQCLALTVENPPERGDYRVFNQFAEVYDLGELATKVQKVAAEAGLHTTIRNLVNPRSEQEDHYYNPDHDHLFELGYRPSGDIDSEIRVMLADLMPHRERIAAKRDVLIPDVGWTGPRRKMKYLASEEPLAIP